MRFLEHHIQTILGGKDTPLAKACVPVDVNNIAEWYFTESDVDDYSIRDQFPSCVAPFPVCFFEYRIPETWRVRDPLTKEWVKVEQDMCGGNIGVLVLQEKLPDGYHGADMDEGNTLSKVRSAMKEDPGDPRFRQYVMVYAGAKDKIVLAASATFYLDQDGKMIGGPMHDLDPILIYKHHKSEAEAFAEFMRAYAFPMYFATSVLTCKNVTLEERKATPEQIKKAMKRKTRAFDYRVIVVEALRKSVLSGEHGGGNTVMTALRIGRGHWKDYTQGKGLFGKLKGRFWWDSFVTGDDKVISDIRMADLRRYQPRI